mmetsp:Transcript_3857/g.11830  ORF Transcript_3857/g.11830 Transcript_3857/m.11830 type:complete len:215 (-) Transcript_3857:691-1335(-)
MASSVSCACLKCALRAFSLAGSRSNSPSLKITSPAILTTHFSGIESPRAPRTWPSLPTRRPTFGSLPAMAHFKRGPFKIARPSSRAARSSRESPRTVTRTTWFVPSPLRTMWCASCAQTAPRPSSNAAAAAAEPAPELKHTTMSLVDSSPSMPMELYVRCTTRCRHACSSARPIFASVRTKESMVARLGSIMPAPFAMPTMVSPEGSVYRATLA